MPKIKRIHINQHNIRWNAKNPLESHKPVMSVKCGNIKYVGHSAEVLGESKVVYSPEKPLSCGAKVWIETTAQVNLDDLVID
jgi:hypothetical protein